MSIEAVQYVFKLKAIEPQFKYILLCLANHVEPTGDTCSVSIRRLSIDTCMSVPTLNRWMAKLKAAGFVTSTRTGQQTGTNMYTLTGYTGDDASAIGQQLVDSFERFWHEYPKKQSKTGAFKSWMRIKPTSADMVKIIQHLDVMCKQEWTRDNMKFIPMATTYINNRRWNDEMPEDSGYYKGGKNERLLYL